MKKAKKIVYWIATIWLSFGMAFTGIIQLMRMQEEADMMQHLGYPPYFLTLLGTWKLLGVVAILVPTFTLLKEWAYAGFFFAMSGAVFSHAAMGDEATEYIGPLLLIVLTLLSWYLRPASRKINATPANP